MKIKKHFVLQEVADEHLVVPVAEEGIRLHGIITLNDTGAFLWKILSEHESAEDELIKELVSEYQIDEATAKEDVKAFLETLDSYGCFE